MPDGQCKVVAIWIDWYAYHIARFRGLLERPMLKGSVVGLEMVGGIGVHAGLKFRENIPASLPVHTLLPGGNWANSQRTLALKTWKFLSKLNPEVVLIPGYYNLPALSAALWAKLRNRKSVLMTESTAKDHERTWWREKIKEYVIALLFNWAVAGGKRHRAYLQQLRFPIDRILSCYDVVDNHFFAASCSHHRSIGRGSDLGLPAEYFLYVGRIAKEKGITGLLESYADYRRRGGTWALILVGDGPEMAATQRLTQHLDLTSHIVFAGLKSSFDIAPYYAFASAFVLASIQEPWGLVVNEAMASSLPVIVSRSCGCSQDLIQHGLNGFLIDPHNSWSLTEALLKMSSTPLATRERMGQMSSEIISQFSPDAFAKEIEKIVISQ